LFCPVASNIMKLAGCAATVLSEDRHRIASRWHDNALWPVQREFLFY